MSDVELTVCMDTCKHHYRETIFGRGTQETSQRCSNSPKTDPVTGHTVTECDKINDGCCPNFEHNDGVRSRRIEIPTKEQRDLHDREEKEERDREYATLKEIRGDRW